MFLLVFHLGFLVEGKERLAIIFKWLMGEYMTEGTGQGAGAGHREGGTPHGRGTWSPRLCPRLAQHTGESVVIAGFIIIQVW